MKQIEERYISLLTDFGFKRIFGTAMRTVEVQKQIPAIGSLSYSRDFSIIRCSA
jgi:S-adenosylmethionine hydrolase